MAARHIRSGEEVMRIPWRLVPQAAGVLKLWATATPELTSTPSAKTALERAVPALSSLEPRTLLALWLLVERARGPASPWAAYIAALPAYVPLPLFYSGDLLDELQYKPFVVKVRPPQAASWTLCT